MEERSNDQIRTDGTCLGVPRPYGHIRRCCVHDAVIVEYRGDGLLVTLKDVPVLFRLLDRRTLLCPSHVNCSSAYTWSRPRSRVRLTLKGHDRATRTAGAAHQEQLAVRGRSPRRTWRGSSIELAPLWRPTRSPFRRQRLCRGHRPR